MDQEMSTKMNAEELANAMFPPTETLRREVAVSVITEVAQPLADELATVNGEREQMLEYLKTAMHYWKLYANGGRPIMAQADVEHYAIGEIDSFIQAKYPRKP